MKKTQKTSSGGNIYNIYFVQIQDGGNSNSQVMQLDEKLVQKLIEIIHKDEGNFTTKNE